MTRRGGGRDASETTRGDRMSEPNIISANWLDRLSKEFTG